MLDSRDLAVNIRGAACTGKTATLQEVHRGLEESGRRVLAVAPTMSAVEELRKVGFSDAVTVERLLQDQSVQEELRGKVLVVDEAGMISGRQMSDLLKLAELQSALWFSAATRNKFKAWKPRTRCGCWKKNRSWIAVEFFHRTRWIVVRSVTVTRTWSSRRIGFECHCTHRVGLAKLASIGAFGHVGLYAFLYALAAHWDCS